MAAIDQLFEIVEKYSTPNLLAFEGLPFVGKTSIVARLGEELHVPTIPEHVDFSSSFRAKLQASWPSSREEIISRQRLALQVDIDSSTLARSFRSSVPVIMDRSPLSPAICSVARLRYRADQSLIHRLLAEMSEAAAANRVLIPSRIWVLKVPTNELHTCVVSAGRAHHSIDPYLMNRSNRRYIERTYDQNSNRFPDRVVVR